MVNARFNNSCNINFSFFFQSLITVWNFTQLKTMLIEMGSLSSDNIPVATPPEILPYQPAPIPPMWSPEGSFQWSTGRDIDHNMVNRVASLGNVDR